jgi:hypothetical protein
LQQPGVALLQWYVARCGRLPVGRWPLIVVVAMFIRVVMVVKPFDGPG